MTLLDGKGLHNHILTNICLLSQDEISSIYSISRHVGYNLKD